MTGPRNGVPPRRHPWTDRACEYRVLADDPLLGVNSYRYFPTYDKARWYAAGKTLNGQPAEVEQRL